MVDIGAQTHVSNNYRINSLNTDPFTNKETGLDVFSNLHKK